MATCVKATTPWFLSIVILLSLELLVMIVALIVKKVIERKNRPNAKVRDYSVKSPTSTKVPKAQDDDHTDVKRKLTALLSTRRKSLDAEVPAWAVKYSTIKFKKRIGQGNFGEVWVANWNGTPVAVKTVLGVHQADQEFTTRFLDEISIMSGLHHPNVVMFLGACVERNKLCLLLEYCELGDLISFLQSKEMEVDMHLKIKFAVDTARGIKYIHEKMHVIQRDVKGRNILIDGNLNAKLSDFGLSREKDADATMTACGTPAWIAPEIVKMEHYTEKADVYSFGIVMWEIYCEKEPYEGEGGLQIAYLAAEKNKRPEVPSFCPESWVKLMKKCWATKPEVRPTFNDILKALLDMMKIESDPEKRVDFYFGTPTWAKEDGVEEVKEGNAVDEDTGSLKITNRKSRRGSFNLSKKEIADLQNKFSESPTTSNSKRDKEKPVEEEKEKRKQSIKVAQEQLEKQLLESPKAGSDFHLRVTKMFQSEPILEFEEGEAMTEEELTILVTEDLPTEEELKKLKIM